MRRIDELILVVGPSSAGKSFLISRIREREEPVLQAQLGMIMPEAWAYLTADQFARTDNADTVRVLVHYDLCQQYRNGIFNHLPAMLYRAEKTTLLTLSVTSETLRERNRVRLNAVIRRMLGGSLWAYEWKTLRYMLHLSRIYKRDEAVKALYGKWFAFADPLHEVAHWTLDPTSTPLVATPAVRGS